jgi:hypothetical protein
VRYSWIALILLPARIASYTGPSAASARSSAGATSNPAGGPPKKPGGMTPLSMSAGSIPMYLIR